MDALVLGAGPAGCAAAITLAAAGWQVSLVDRPPVGGPRVGESLSPAGPGLLAQLGVLGAFCQDGHLPCHANVSVWGGPTPRWQDFLRDPRGHGYHVDRARFEQRLRERAAELGVSSIGPQGAGARAGDRWVFGGSERSARYVVDASGRAAVFARGLGVRREVAWEQAALVGFARANRPIEEAYTLVEAVEAGFWYTAPTPGGRFVVALFTDAKLHAGRGGDATATLSRLLADAPHTRARLEAHGAVLEGAPRFVDAGSARLATAQGAGWIAVGDAALAYDPVSAHGLTLALRTGIDAAAALLADAAGDTGRTGALLRYQARLDGAFASHCAEALRIYGSEPRWTNAPYWRRRRELGRAT